ncbi:hypothetical protein PAEH1_02620 [Paenalcaligenes hominis]|uniref:Bacteriophage tail tape measure C-terminal domain-containing protein n=1 Tax=Paenalcaligenes hominis TaxID=643674 RepID=A0A1U9JY48_9BURK|nr:hypothetical protein PAEH1_02620 [Paenalcaligenes hominis]
MILSAGAAILTMSRNARDAKPQIDFLALSIKDLTNETLALTKVDLIRYIKELGGLGTEASKASAQIETLQARLKEAPGSPMADSWRREIEKLSAVVDIAQSQMKPYEKLLEQITKLEEERKNQTKEGYRDPEADRILADKRKELELIKLEGEARARLKAIHDLGDNASPEQKKEAEELAAQIYRIEEARKKAAAANKKGLKESEQAAKENKKAVADLSEELRLATLEGKALAEAQALSKLNKFATPDDIARVKALAGAIYELELAEQNRQMLADMDSVEAERQRFEEQLGSLKRLHEAKLLEDQRYYDLKEGLEREHNERMRQAEEERFAAQSWQNEMVIKGLNNLEQATASAMTGLLSGASNSTQAIQALAAGISQELIGSIVKMGFEQVKAWAMGQVAQKAAAAGYVASVAGQVKANTALAAQAAFTSIAAIPITGPAMAPAAAAAAAATSASLGAPAIAAAATSYGGGRQYGGPTSAGKMYRINEDGRPEVFNAANGQQYLLPNTRGQVISNKDAAAGGSNINVSVTVHSNGEITSDIGALTGMGQDIGRAVQAIVKRELNMAMQPGGVIRSRGY